SSPSRPTVSSASRGIPMTASRSSTVDPAGTVWRWGPSTPGGRNRRRSARTFTVTAIVSWLPILRFASPPDAMAILGHYAAARSACQLAERGGAGAPRGYVFAADARHGVQCPPPCLTGWGTVPSLAHAQTAGGPSERSVRLDRQRCAPHPRHSRPVPHRQG